MAGLVQYNFTIDDASPVFTYSPYSDFFSATGRGDGLQNGWQTWYTGSGYLSGFDGPSSVGESFHLTSLSGASVSLSFYGTGVSLHGISNCSYDVVFDGSLVPNTALVQGVFFSTANEEPGAHNISIIARPDGDNQILSFNRAIVTSLANATAPAPVTATVESQNTDTITYTGEWTPSNLVSNSPSSATSASFHSTTEYGASASLNFTGRAVALYGASTTNHGLYSVTLDDVQYSFNGSSQWPLDNMLMFYQDGLDEAYAHSLSLTNLGDGRAMSLNSVKITQFSNMDNDSSDVTGGSSRVGAIVGPVIALAVLIGVVGLFIWTRRRDKRHPRKLERRSSVTSSIFLPPGLRRKYGRSADGINPYAVDLRTSFHAGARGSIASSNASTLCGDYQQWIVSGVDEKNVPSPNYGADTLATPVAHTLDEAHPSTTQAGHDLDGPTYPPPVARPSITSDSANVFPSRVRTERVPETELTAQRPDSRSITPSNPRRDSIDRLPPYPEDV